MPNGPQMFIPVATEPVATMVMDVGAASWLRFGKKKGINNGVCGGYIGVNPRKGW